MKQAKPATKSLSLPKPIAAYFAADRGDGEAVSQCFTENAVVKDKGRTHKGRAAIQEWKTDASAKYQYTCEPLACEERDGKTVVMYHYHATWEFPYAVGCFHGTYTARGPVLGPAH